DSRGARPYSCAWRSRPRRMPRRPGEPPGSSEIVEHQVRRNPACLGQRPERRRRPRPEWIASPVRSRDYRARRLRLRVNRSGRPRAPVSVRRSPVSHGRATARSWQRADLNGRRAAGRGAVAELALEIRAPAIRGVERGCAGDATRVEPSRAHGNKGEPTGYLHGREALRNRRTSAQLAGLAESPAVRCPRRRDAARVAAITGAGAQRGETESTKDSDRARCESRRPVAQLTPEVLAPAIGHIRGGQAAGVGRA